MSTPELPFIQPRQGAPQRAAGVEGKTRYLAVRLTPRQLATVDAAAARAGRTRPAWLRDRWSRCQWDVAPLSASGLALLRRVADPLNATAHQLNLSARDPEVPRVETSRLELLVKALELQVFPVVEAELVPAEAPVAKLRCADLSSDLPSSQLERVVVRVTPAVYDLVRTFVEGCPSRSMQTALENQLFGRLVPAENAAVWTELARSVANLVQIEQHIRADQPLLADRFVQACSRLQVVRRRLLGAAP